jgi:hypothetical protein
MTNEVREVLTKIFGAITVACLVLAAIAQCSAGQAEVDAQIAYERGALLEERLAEERGVVRAQEVVVAALRDTTDALRVETARVAAQAAEDGRRAALRVDELLDEGRAVAGDSIATVRVIQELGGTIDSLEVAHTEEVEALMNANSILWRRIDVTDILLAQQVALTQTAESALSEYRLGAERAMYALRASRRRDTAIKVGLGLGVALALVNSLR